MKDKANILTYDKWSCGDYTKSSEEFTHYTTIPIQYSTEWSINGESSIKITPKENSQYLTIFFEYITSQIKNNISLKCNIKSNSSGKLIIYKYFDDGSFIPDYITITNNTGSYLLNSSITDEIKRIWVRYDSNSNNGILFIDNIKLTTNQ